MAIYEGKILVKVNKEDIVDGNYIVRDGVTDIGEKAFCGLTELNNVKLPKSIIKIGAHAFDGCVNLRNIDNLRNVQYMDEKCFAFCSKLNIAVDLKSLKFAFNDVFINCPQIEFIYAPNDFFEQGYFVGVSDLCNIYKSATNLNIELKLKYEYKCFLKEFREGKYNYIVETAIREKKSKVALEILRVPNFDFRKLTHDNKTLLELAVDNSLVDVASKLIKMGMEVNSLLLVSARTPEMRKLLYDEFEKVKDKKKLNVEEITR